MSQELWNCYELRQTRKLQMMLSEFGASTTRVSLYWSSSNETLPILVTLLQMHLIEMNVSSSVRPSSFLVMVALSISFCDVIAAHVKRIYVQMYI